MMLIGKCRKMYRVGINDIITERVFHVVEVIIRLWRGRRCPPPVVAHRHGRQRRQRGDDDRQNQDRPHRRTQLSLATSHHRPGHHADVQAIRPRKTSLSAFGSCYSSVLHLQLDADDFLRVPQPMRRTGCGSRHFAVSIITLPYSAYRVTILRHYSNIIIVIIIIISSTAELRAAGHSESRHRNCSTANWFFPTIVARRHPLDSVPPPARVAGCCCCGCILAQQLRDKAGTSARDVHSVVAIAEKTTFLKSEMLVRMCQSYVRRFGS